MLGFTRNEQKVLLFLAFSFVAGGALKEYQDHWQALPASTGDKILKEFVESDVMTVSASRKETGESGTFFTVPLNSATKTDLEHIPGIGPVMAQRILSYRAMNGRFRTIEELLNVKGIGPKKMQKIRPYVRIQ
jgi:comEA protein